ncbi:MAG: ATP-binding protein [Anaerolineae bacterium]|nr:ATP-binding protein [Anaerolineae bacterium]
MYLEDLDPNASLTDHLTRLLTRNVMLDDAGALLRDQLSEPRNYATLVENIASGFTRLSDIARMSGMEDGAASKYLGVLKKLGVVERAVPATVTRPAQSKLGRYRIVDPYLRFYYRFIWPNRTLIASGRLDVPLATLQQHLHEFVGKHSFEELCREWVLDYAGSGQLGFVPRRIGSFWRSRSGETSGMEIDVMAINEDEHEMLIGECKFTREAIGASVVRKLIEDKTPLVDIDMSKKWTIRYAFFSRSGFSSDARTAAKRFDCEFVDLTRLERDLRKS